MLTIRAMSDGKGYAAKHLVHSDYYDENKRVVGQWFGKGAEQLGLSGDVNLEDFEAVRECRDPKTGEFPARAAKRGPAGCGRFHSEQGPQFLRFHGLGSKVGI